MECKCNRNKLLSKPLTQEQRDEMLIGIWQGSLDASYSRLLSKEADTLKELQWHDYQAKQRQNQYLFIFIAFGVGCGFSQFLQYILGFLTSL